MTAKRLIGAGIGFKPGSSAWVLTRGLGAFLAPPVVTPPSFESLLSGQNGPIVATFSVDMRSANNILLRELPEAMVETGSITLDNDRAIQRTCDVTLSMADLPPSFDTLTSHIAIHMTVGSETFQLGLFRLTNPVEQFSSDGHDLLRVRGSDLGFVLQKSKAQTTFEVPAGSSYVAAVREIIALVGLQHSIPDSPLMTPIAFTWAAGIPYLRMINDLLIGINYHELFASPTGVMTSTSRVSPYGATVNVHYRNDIEPRMLIAPFLPGRTEATIPNVLLGEVVDPNRELIAVTVTNSDASSPWSTPSTQAQWANLTLDRIADTPTLLDVTEYELRLATGVGEPATLTTLTDPRRTAHEVYRLTILGSDGTPIEDGSLWRVRGWVLSLATGVPMRHTLQAARPLVLERSE